MTHRTVAEFQQAYNEQGQPWFLTTEYVEGQRLPAWGFHPYADPHDGNGWSRRKWGASFEYTKRELDANDGCDTVWRRAEYALMGAPYGPYLV